MCFMSVKLYFTFLLPGISSPSGMDRTSPMNECTLHVPFIYDISYT